MPDYSDPAPVRQQIARDLRGQIRAGTYPPESRLPSNTALAKHYGVATETVRAALDELRAEKIVETRSTRGTYVMRAPAAESAQPDLRAVSEQLAELAARVGEYDDLRARVGRMEAIIVNLLKRSGLPNPFGGEHDEPGKTARRGRAG